MKFIRSLSRTFLFCKLACLIASLALASWASAGTYTVTTTAAQDTLLVSAIPFINSYNCQRVGLAVSCTTAQLQARNPRLHIYTADTTATGVQQLLQDNLTDSSIGGGVIADAIALMRNNQHVTFEAALAAATQAQRDSACTAIGLASGCRQ